MLLFLKIDGLLCLQQWSRSVQVFIKDETDFSLHLGTWLVMEKNKPAFRLNIIKSSLNPDFGYVLKHEKIQNILITKDQGKL